MIAALTDTERKWRRMRLIDADALIDKAKEYGGYYEDTVYAVPLADISDAPSIEPKRGEWIPCSERLPKENTEVLMSLEWGVDIGEYRNGEWHSEWINHYDDGNVLAWMPLPKPWKGADDE